MLTRRHLLLGGTGAAVIAASRIASARSGSAQIPAVVTTWEFAPAANAAAWKILGKGGSALDAVEAGINQAELDPDNEDVGFGGTPNYEGETTLDAMIMWGPRHEVGAVGCLKRVARAVSVARAVLEKTRHSFLVGDDATRFAVSQGFAETSLINQRSIRMWEEWVAKGRKPNPFDPEPRGGRRKPSKSHDTIGMIAVDKRGDICAGCSTNGLNFKLPGRVGDSPIAGAGAYCDNEVGAAAATGNGDVMMRFLPAYQAVENMRAGMAPAEAARAALARITGKGYQVGGALICLNKRGEYGAATMEYQAFPYGVRTRSVDQLLTVEPA